MVKVPQNLERLLDDLVRLLAANVGYKANSAGVVLEGGVVQPFGLLGPLALGLFMQNFRDVRLLFVPYMIRGVGDILIAVVDGLKGFPEAITAVFAQTTVQTCIVHLTRFSLAYCSWPDRKKVAAKVAPVRREAPKTKTKPKKQVASTLET